MQVSNCHSSPSWAGGTWILGALKLYCPIYNRSSGRNRAFIFPQILELFLRAICGDSILRTASPRANIVKFCVHLSRTVEIAVHNCMLPRRSVYISSTFASILGCLLEALFFAILMNSHVLKEILLLASVILPQLALLGWGVLGA